MRNKLLISSILMMTLAYIISYYLLCSTPPYLDMVNGEIFNVKSLIFTNSITVAFIIAAYYFKKSIYKAVAIVCLIFSSFAVLPHSKLLIGSSEVENYIPIELTAIITLVVIVLLMFALRFKKYQEHLKEWYFEGAEEKEIHKILTKRIKLYSISNILVFLACLFLTGIGFSILYKNPSPSLIMLTAVLGLIILVGCIIFISKKIFFVK